MGTTGKTIGSARDLALAQGPEPLWCTNTDLTEASMPSDTPAAKILHIFQSI
jgi:hypothetical protein